MIPADLAARGEQLGIPPALQRQIAEQWIAFRKRYGLEAVDVERTVVHDRWRLAGTLDRRDRCTKPLNLGDRYAPIEPGDLIVGDIKTGGLTLDDDGTPHYWVKYVVQLAAYADAVPYDTDTDERGEW